MPWKRVEKAQNICFSKHEKLVISYGKKEVGKQFLPPSERITGCPTIFTAYLFVMLKLLSRESDINIFVAFPPKTISLFFPPN